MRSTFYLCSKIIITLAFPILVFIILFSDQIMSFFGDEYYQGAIIFKDIDCWSVYYSFMWFCRRNIKYDWS